MSSNIELIEKISKISTPIVYDAIEKFNLRSRSEGYTDSTIRCMFPSIGPVCGYACTAKITGVLPKAEGERLVSSKDVWKYVDASPKPGIMAVQDLDSEPRRACAWGDFSASIFKAMGCRGAITNGFVRDVEVVEKIGFQFFASSTIAGHGNIRYVEINTPVIIGGLIINPGDLIHGDIHGVINIPKDLPLVEIIQAVQKCLDSEGKVISYCNSKGFNIEGLFREVDEHEKRSDGHFK